jgi:hypothetical protein
VLVGPALGEGLYRGQPVGPENCAHPTRTADIRRTGSRAGSRRRRLWISVVVARDAGSGMAKVRCERPLIDRTGWSKSGAQVWAELRSTASNGPELHCRDRRILCFRRPRDFANQPGGKGVAGSNPVVPTARSAGQSTCASWFKITSPVCCPMDCPSGRS